MDKERRKSFNFKEAISTSSMVKLPSLTPIRNNTFNSVLLPAPVRPTMPIWKHQINYNKNRTSSSTFFFFFIGRKRFKDDRPTYFTCFFVVIINIFRKVWKYLNEGKKCRGKTPTGKISSSRDIFLTFLRPNFQIRLPGESFVGEFLSTGNSPISTLDINTFMLVYKLCTRYIRVLSEPVYFLTLIKYIIIMPVSYTHLTLPTIYSV